MERKIVELDVREILRAKQEPFQRIMETVGNLTEGDVFELHATFQPDPLIRVLGKQGYLHSVVEEGPEHFIVQFYKGDGEPSGVSDVVQGGVVNGRRDQEGSTLPWFHLDNRELDPPQPMVRVLEFLDGHPTCHDGRLGLEIWNVRVPAFLLPELEERGFASEIEDEGNGTVRVKIYKPQ